MKIGKLTRWILVVGLIVVALSWLGGNIVRQIAQQNELNNNLTTSQEQLAIITAQHQQTVAEYSAQKSELEEILGEPIPSVSALISKFESPGESIEITEQLYEDAYQSNVTLLTIATALPQGQEYKKETEDGNKIVLLTYETTSIQLTAKGEVVALLNFLDKLSARFQTSYINQVSISVPEGVYTEEEEAAATEPQIATIKIDIDIYASEDGNE